MEGRKDGKSANAWADWRPAIVPALALIAVGVIPGMLKGLYEPYTANLMTAYVSFGMLFIVAIMGGLAIMVVRDMSSRRMKIFRLAPSEQSAGEADGAVRVEEDHIERR